MKRIRIEISSGAKALQTSVLVFVNKKDCRICQEKNANESNGNISLCASRYESRNGRHFGIVESAVVVGASRKEAFQRLEPCAVKVASTVLRGGSDSNITSLPDYTARYQRIFTFDGIPFNFLLRKSFAIVKKSPPILL